jgi:phosphoenolpyruvate-protein phosphotransferase
MTAEIAFQGVGASPGLAEGPAFIWREKETVIPRHMSKVPAEVEYQRLSSAIQRAKVDLGELRASLADQGMPEEAEVFQAHISMLEDPTLDQFVRAKLKTGINTEAAWIDSVNELADQLAAIPDPVFSARAADLRDVGKRVIRLLLGMEQQDEIQLQVPSIIFARDLCPSETATLDKTKVLALCTAEGATTSHTAILARSLGIPAVVGTSGDLLDIAPGTPILIDGGAGTVLANPTGSSLAAHREKKSAWETRAAAEIRDSQIAAVTLDGHRVEVVANVGNLDDAHKALELGAEGIGLLRTEFLFIDRKNAPTEEEQYKAYADILDTMEHRPVVARTIDVGGDKSIPYLDLGEEANPFLGFRAIRMCLEHVDFFKTQLRALLRAGHGHDLRIMFPMIATLDEVRQAKAIIEEVKTELAAQGASFAERPPIGIMVEIPSVALLADQFSRIVDFFSIGTNDLTQYTMAVDRTNPRVAHIGDACNPAVIREIQNVILQAHKAGIWVGVCGEMAGDPEAVPILLGLGLDEFSASPHSIPRAKSIIRSLKLSDAQALASHVLDCESSGQVREAVKTLLESAGRLHGVK